MKLDFGNYQIVTDERQFIVKGRKIVQEHRLAKEENIGSTYWDVAGYYSNLNSALLSLPKRVLLANDDLEVISKELKLIESKIKEFTKKLNITV